MLKILVGMILAESILPIYYLYMKHISIKDNDIKKRYQFPLISIIIPTFNEETTIISKLKNISELEYPHTNLEIFVIDGNSKDKTVELVREFQNDSCLNITLIQEKEQGGKIKAINSTVPLCKGELICISDSDCIWQKDALKEAVANFSDQRIGAVTGLQILMAEDAFAEKVEGHYNNFYNILRKGESVLDSTPIFRGELTIVRGNLFKQIEVGTESAWADDSEIAMKIRKLGYRSIVDTTAKFYEFAPPTLDSRKKQKSRRGLGLIKLFLNNWKIMLNPYKYGKYSLICMSNLFYLVISPILIFSILVISAKILLSFPIDNILYLISILMGLSLLQYKIFENKIGQFAYSFLHSQFTLLVSLPFIMSKDAKWSQITEIRDKWRKKNHE